MMILKNNPAPTRFACLLTGKLALCLLMAALLLPTAAAFADCDAHAPMTGATVTCSAGGGTDTSGVAAVTGASDVTINVQTGAVVSIAGVALSVGDDSSIANAGQVATTGRTGHGLRAHGDHSQLTNAAGGHIETQGRYGEGLSARGNGDRLVNQGTIQTMGANGYGLHANGDGNHIDNQGTVSTQGDKAEGFYVTGNSNALTNEGTITTTNNNADGFYVSGADNMLTNAAGGKIATQGQYGVGLYASGDGSLLTNLGTISTSGETADGLNLSGDNATLANKGSIATSNRDSYGIYASGTGNMLRNSGDVSVNGDTSEGLAARGGENTLTNADGGDIETRGHYGYGLRAYDDGNRLDNQGTIGTMGEVGNGLDVVGDNNTLTNEGAITTTNTNAYGIDVLGTGNVLRNTGTISVAGDTSDGLGTQGSDNTLINAAAGDVETRGQYGHGLYAHGDGNRLDNQGTIRTAGEAASGLRADGNNNVLTNEGALQTSGQQSDVVQVNGNGNTVTNGAGGVVAASGSGNGISATGDRNEVVNNAAVNIAGYDTGGVFTVGQYNHVTNNGSVTGTGDDENGIRVDGAHAAVTNTGTLAMSGYSGWGIEVGDGNAIVDNSGSIITRGDASQGLHIGGDGNRVTNGGTVSTHGQANNGVHSAGVFFDSAAGNKNLLTNNAGGVIEAAGDTGVIGGVGDETVIDAGRISGAGKAIDLGAGTDTVVLDDGAVINGLIDGGAGSDSLTLRGSAAGSRLGADQVAHFEALTKQGDGTWTLHGAAADNAPWTVSGGTLVGDAASLAGGVVNHATVVFDQASDADYAAPIGGDGALIKRGAGSLALTAAAETATTRVESGRLAVNAPLRASNGLGVARGAVLGGDSAITADVSNAGTVAPGNSPGTLSIQGNYTQAPGATLDSQIQADGPYDRLQVSGRATLAGGLRVEAAPGRYRPGQHFDILTAKQRRGTFATTTLSGDPLKLYLNYKTDRARLVVIDPQLAGDGSDPVQRQVGQWLDNNIPAGICSSANCALAASLSGDRPAVGFDQFSPAVYGADTDAAFIQHRLVDSALDSALRRPPKAAQRVWANVVGSHSVRDDTADHIGFGLTTSGIVAGTDKRVMQGLRFGVLGAQLHARAQFARGNASRWSDDASYLGLYGDWTRGLVFAHAAAARGWLTYDAARSPAAGLPSANSSHAGRQWTGRVVTGIEWPLGEVAAVVPSLGLDYDHLAVDGFDEHGAGIADLAVDDRTRQSLRSAVDVRLQGRSSGGDAFGLEPSVHVGWRHQYLDRHRSVAARIDTLGAPVAVDAGPESRNALVTGAGARLRLGRDAGLFARADVTLARERTRTSVLVGFHVGF